MDDFDLEIKREFISEAMLNLEEVEASFMELESSSDTKPLLDKIFRVAHNLKGGSRAVGFGDVAEFTHQLENLVLKIQKAEVTLTPDVITTLLKSNDRLVEMLNELKGNMAATFNNADLLAEIQSWLDGKTSEAAPEKVVAASVETSAAAEFVAEVKLDEPNLVVPEAGSFFADEVPKVEAVSAQVVAAQIQAEEQANDSAVEDVISKIEKSSVQEVARAELKHAAELKHSAELKHPAEPKLSVVPAATAAPQTFASPAKEVAPKTAASAAKANKEDEVVRVNISRINLLNDYVGEMIVLQSVIQQQSSSGAPTLQGSLRQMGKLSKDIQNLSMSLRMLPVKPLVQKLQRVVRDTSQALAKEVQLELIGDQIDVDKSVLDQLVDPLIHILRNAVDHGVETPEERRNANKNPQGRITLAFANEGNYLVIEIKDDGKGINSEILRAKAIEKKIISEKQSMTERQLIHLIFHAGFSTKTVTSEVSGRGVGMDVVKTNVERIGGNVEVLTKVGSGSTFRIQIPLSLAVIDGLVVLSEKNRYVIPLSQVQETINLKTQKVFKDKTGIGSCFNLRGAVVPLFDFEGVLNSKNSSIQAEDTALIVNVNDQLLALVVKDILRAQQIVIKPFGNGIKSQKGWIGSCVLGDGLPTLIVSPVDLLSGKVRSESREGKIEKENAA
jgi:two-component system chemotaxis sensor kinase CheA